MTAEHGNVPNMSPGEVHVPFHLGLVSAHEWLETDPSQEVKPSRGPCICGANLGSRPILRRGGPRERPGSLDPLGLMGALDPWIPHVSCMELAATRVTPFPRLSSWIPGERQAWRRECYLLYLLYLGEKDNEEELLQATLNEALSCVCAQVPRASGVSSRGF